jgi:hypothetical protein
MYSHELGHFYDPRLNTKSNAGLFGDALQYQDNNPWSSREANAQLAEERWRELNMVKRKK